MRQRKTDSANKEYSTGDKNSREIETNIQVHSEDRRKNVNLQASKPSNLESNFVFLLETPRLSHQGSKRRGVIILD